jgi:hypothetical protein
MVDDSHAMAVTVALLVLVAWYVGLLIKHWDDDKTEDDDAEN